MAASPLSRGQSLQPDLLRFERREIQRLAPAPVREPGQTLDARVRRPLAAGAILTVDALEPIPLILKGDVVILLATSGPLRVSLEAQALEDGAYGQRIRLKNTTSGKLISAQVSGPRQARIDMP